MHILRHIKSARRRIFPTDLLGLPRRTSQRYAAMLTTTTIPPCAPSVVRDESEAPER